MKLINADTQVTRLSLKILIARNKGLKGYIARLILSKTETGKTLSPWKLSKTDFSGAFVVLGSRAPT